MALNAWPTRGRILDAWKVLLARSSTLPATQVFRWNSLLTVKGPDPDDYPDQGIQVSDECRQRNEEIVAKVAKKYVPVTQLYSEDSALYIPGHDRFPAALEEPEWKRPRIEGSFDSADSALVDALADGYECQGEMLYELMSDFPHNWPSP